MPDFEAPEEDVLEQEQSPDDPESPLQDGPSTDIEAPEADAQEQHRSVRGSAATRSTRRDDVDEADAADQEREVDLDEDEYR